MRLGHAARVRVRLGHRVARAVAHRHADLVRVRLRVRVRVRVRVTFARMRGHI